VVMYNNSLDEEANKLKAATEAQKANNDAVASSQKIIIDTQNLRTRALKDGIEKDLRLNKDKLAIELYENELAYSKSEISATTFGQRQLYIKQNFANEEAKIRKANHDKELAEAKKHIINKQQIGPGVNLFGGLSAAGPTLNPNIIIDPVFKFDLVKAKQNAALEIAKFNQQISQLLEAGLTNSLSNIGKVVGETIAGSISDPFAALGQVLLQSIGGVMTQLGTQMIALGVGMLALDLGIKTLNPFVAIAGGVALVAAGAAISAISAAGTKGGTQSAPSTSAPATSSNFNGNGSNYLGGNNSGNIVINGMIKGNDIQLVNGRNDRKFNRSLRFG